jgi:hypothetical protein
LRHHAPAFSAVAGEGRSPPAANGYALATCPAIWQQPRIKSDHRPETLRAQVDRLLAWLNVTALPRQHLTPRMGK